jgi:hypothetical protein
MSLINCKECGREVSSQAEKCPGCGVTITKRSGFFATTFKWIAGVFLGLVVLGWILDGTSGNGSSSRSAGASYSSSSSTPALPEPPPLEVQSWRCDTEHGYTFVRGEVKNVSSRKLENVTAVGEFRTKAGELVKTEDALLEYNPIMPGQTSPFKASGTENPQIERCSLAFKYLLGGGMIDFTEKDKKQPARARGRQFD